MSGTSRPKFYVTTPIYYVNDVPHIGHAYTTIIADVLARARKLADRDVFFLTGTDEHGQKVQRASAERGLKPRELADRVVVRFQDLWRDLSIEPDFFIRTTMPAHKRGVQKIFKKLKEQGDIYQGTYRGWYCVSDECYLSEDVPEEADRTKICPDCGKTAHLLSEKCYYFRLSAYRERLLDFYARRPDFVRPESRMNEVVSFVRGGLKDLVITRTTVSWGIPFPDDPDHTIYVWFDALHNYVTGVGFDENLELFRKYWPADIHLIGKDILRFHAVFWPAFLMAAGFDLPHCVFSHGWWMMGGAKMSKSRRNVFDVNLILKMFGPDPLRYFLIREIPIGQDGNYSDESFLHRVNSDLANDLGNLVQRTLTLIRKAFGGVLPDPDPETEADAKLRGEFGALKERVTALYEEVALTRALEDVWAYIFSVNKYLADEEPWKMIGDASRRGRLARVLTQAASAVRGISHLLFPVIPGSMRKVWAWLGEEKRPEDVLFRDLEFGGLVPGRNIQEPTPLFPRVALKDFLAAMTEPGAKETKEEAMEQVSYDEFKKMDLRVAHILKAERVPNTDKLLKLEVDIGTETRTLVAGVGDVYAPEDLAGKRLAVIVNLKPAVIRGVESKGMILAAEWQGKAKIAFYDGDVPAGSKIK
ncbi:MAG: methionine--tRNA ligase [Candidatus Aminicenantes bacterium]|nr:methionine--tRNA ligase [Candidatus Aminicenantes bacterium]